MKKFKYIYLLVTIMLLTGCVKSNTEMTINNDKSMVISNELLINEKLIDSNVEGITSEQKKALESRGMNVESIKRSDGYSGYMITKKYDNIDEHSTTEYSLIDISDFFGEKFDDSVLFQVKESFFKNTYIINYKFNFSSDEYIDESIVTSETEDTKLDNVSNENIDLSELSSEMSFKFTLNLPNKALISNASDKSSDGKKLVWNLIDNTETTINCEFELYNLNNIYLIILGVIGFILLIVLIIVLKNKLIQIKRKKISRKPILREYDPSIASELGFETKESKTSKVVSKVKDKEEASDRFEKTDIINIPDDIK